MDITLDLVKEAMNNIDDVVKKTAILYGHKLSKETDMDVYLKLENLQNSGSFKLRGATNKIMNLTEQEKRNGVIASSAGNHAQGVAVAATKLGLTSTIVMPRFAPLAKVNATQEYGGNVILHGDVYDEAYEKAKEIQKETNATFIHPFNDPLVIAGQGTIGIEILEDLENVDYVLVPIGGGGLISGVSIAIKSINPNIKIIGVQTESAPAMRNSFQEGKLLSSQVKATIADGIAVKNPGDLTFGIVQKYVDDIVLVSEDEVAKAVLFLLEKCKIVSEGSGAASVAAVLSKVVSHPKKKVMCIVSGGNIDTTLGEQIINKGLMAEGRRFEIRINIGNRSGELAKLLSLIAEFGANLVNVDLTRYKENLLLNEQGVTLVVDVINADIKNKIIEKIRNHGFNIKRHN